MMKYNQEYYLNEVRRHTFPYKVYSNQTLENSLKNLVKIKNNNIINNTGISIIEHFHPSI